MLSGAYLALVVIAVNGIAFTLSIELGARR